MIGLIRRLIGLIEDLVDWEKYNSKVYLMFTCMIRVDVGGINGGFFEDKLIDGAGDIAKYWTHSFSSHWKR